MLIDRLVFKDFLVFPGEQSIDFTYQNGRNLSLILAPNNSGKTTVIRALEFLLYGEPDDRVVANLPCHAYVAGLEEKKTEECFVEAMLRHGDESYSIRRSVSFARRSESGFNTIPIDCRLEVFRHDRTTDRILPNSAATEDLVANLVPRPLFDFFFFKGEELADKLLRPEKGIQIPDQLKKLLYQREWDDLAETLRKSERHFSKQISALTNEREEYEELALKKDSLSGMISSNEEARAEEKKNHASLEYQWNLADGKIVELSSRANPQRKRELAEVDKRLNLVGRRRKKILEDKKDILGRDSAILLLEGHLPRVCAHLTKLKEDRLLPPDVSEGILSEIMDRECCICGRECKDGTDAYRAIGKLREASLAEGVAEDLWKLHTRTQATSRTGFRTKLRSDAGKLRQLIDEEHGCAVEETTLEGQRIELESAVDESAENQVRAQQLERAKAKEAIGVSEERQRRLTQVIQRDRQLLIDVEAKLRKAGAGVKQAGHWNKAVVLCHTFRGVTEGCQKRMVIAIHTELQKNVSSMYDAIVTDGSGALVDNSTLLPTIERSGVRGLFTGGGQDQVLLLCYLISLARLRKTINSELRCRFGIAQFYDQGFFMDSVFGQTQAAYKRSVVKLLPQHMKQLVLMLADQQWDHAVEEGVLEHATNIYGFEQFTPQKVDEREFIFQVNGQKVKLLSRLEPGDQPRTVIRKIS